MWNVGNRNGDGVQPKKSSVLVFSGIRFNNGWEIQGKKIEGGEKYRYLGVSVSVGKDIFSE